MGVRDIDMDGNPDLIFQHTDGSLAAWLMDSTKLRSAAYLHPATPSEPGWKVVGTGDFYGKEDGSWDLRLQHGDGSLAVWSMRDTTLTTASYVSPSRPDDVNWRVVAIADLDQDGKSDLLFQHQKDQGLAVWYMDGATSTKAAFLDPRYPGGTWKAVGPR